MNRTTGAAAAALILGLGLTGCSATPGDGAGTEQPVDVLASFYPLQYAAQEVGGEHVSVSSLTPPGASPHDLELSPQQVNLLGEHGVVVYLSGFQASVDEAVAATEPAHVVDAADAAGIARSSQGGESAGPTGGDPHFWLDPLRLAEVAGVVADALSAADPEHSVDYHANAER